MNKKILSLIILFLGVFSVIQAQNDGKIRVKGVVLDETTRQPIAFANIGIIGTAAGAASDMDGLFELIVSGTCRRNRTKEAGAEAKMTGRENFKQLIIDN